MSWVTAKRDKVDVDVYVMSTTAGQKVEQYLDLATDIWINAGKAGVSSMRVMDAIGKTGVGLITGVEVRVSTAAAMPPILVFRDIFSWTCAAEVVLGETMRTGGAIQEVLNKAFDLDRAGDWSLTLERIGANPGVDAETWVEGCGGAGSIKVASKDGEPGKYLVVVDVNTTEAQDKLYDMYSKHRWDDINPLPISEFVEKYWPLRDAVRRCGRRLLARALAALGQTVGALSQSVRYVPDSKAVLRRLVVGSRVSVRDEVPTAAYPLETGDPKEKVSTSAKLGDGEGLLALASAAPEGLPLGGKLSAYVLASVRNPPQLAVPQFEQEYNSIVPIFSQPDVAGCASQRRVTTNYALCMGVASPVVVPGTRRSLIQFFVDLEVQKIAVADVSDVATDQVAFDFRVKAPRAGAAQYAVVAKWPAEPAKPAKSDK